MFTKPSLGPFWSILALSGTTHVHADIFKLDMVQRRYARYTCNDIGRTSSVNPVLHQIGCEALHERRTKFRLAMQLTVSAHGQGPCLNRLLSLYTILFSITLFCLNILYTNIPFCRREEDMPTKCSRVS